MKEVRKIDLVLKINQKINKLVNTTNEIDWKEKKPTTICSIAKKIATTKTLLHTPIDLSPDLNKKPKSKNCLKKTIKGKIEK
jgi:hypothetical protein